MTTSLSHQIPQALAFDAQHGQHGRHDLTLSREGHAVIWTKRVNGVLYFRCRCGHAWDTWPDGRGVHSPVCPVDRMLDDHAAKRLALAESESADIAALLRDRTDALLALGLTE